MTHHGNTGCASYLTAESITYEGKELVRIGEACVGCMKGKYHSSTRQCIDVDKDKWNCSICVGWNYWGLCNGMLRYLLRHFWFSGRHYVQNPEHNVTVRKSAQQQEVTIHQTGFNSNITSTMMTEPNLDLIGGDAGTQQEIIPKEAKENFWDNV